MGGLSCYEPFLSGLVAGGYRRVVLPNKDRAGRRAVAGFKAVLNILGVGVLVSDERDGKSAGERERSGWFGEECRALEGRVVGKELVGPLVYVGNDRWLGGGVKCGVELRPGLDFPPVVCCVLASFFKGPVLIGEALEAGELRCSRRREFLREVDWSVEVLLRPFARKLVWAALGAERRAGRGPKNVFFEACSGQVSLGPAQQSLQKKKKTQ